MHSSIVLGLFASVAVATNSVSVYPAVDPDKIPVATRYAWCNSQLAACPPLCLNQESGAPQDNGNQCDPDDLTYTCICQDGKSPNATQYSETMPYYICTQQVINCVNNCGSDNLCGEACKSNKHCGASNPLKPNKTSSHGSSPTATSDSSTVAYDGFGGSDSTATAGAGSTGSANSGSINLKGAGNGLVAFGEIYSVALLAASFGLSIFAFL